MAGTRDAKERQTKLNFRGLLNFRRAKGADVAEELASAEVEVVSPDDPYALARQDRRSQLCDQVRPWSLIQTHASFDHKDVADPAFAEAFREFGVVKVRNVLSDEEVERYLSIVKEVSKHNETSFLETYAGDINSYAKPGTVNDTPELWPMASLPKVRKALKSLYGEAACFLADTVFVHYSAPHLHRDCSSYHKADAGKYNLIDDRDHYIANVMHYLNDPGRESVKLGYVPFSHSQAIFEKKLSVLKQLAGDRVSDEWFDQLSSICKASFQQPGEDENVVWVDVEPQDIAIFDTRLLHQGQRMGGAKYAVSFFFGVSDEFTRQMLFTSVLNKANDGFGEFSDGYTKFLKENEIYPAGLDDPEMLKAFEAEQNG